MLSKRTQKEIIFDDLDSPKLTFLQKIALSNSKKGKINFTQAAVLDAAKKQTGLSDFGDESFREALQVLLDAYKSDK